ncbi:MAG: head GIN domain-containing protein [Sphingomonadaceae bacterium]
MTGFRCASAAMLMLAVTAPAAAAERGFSVTDFDRVRLEGPYAVEIATGRGTTARASGDREAIERVSLQVQGRTLVIRPDRNSWGGYPGEKREGRVVIRLTTGELRSIALSGSGSMTIDRARGARVELIVQGSGRLDIARVETDRLDIGIMGSGAVRLGGTVKALNALVRGSAALDGAALTANDLSLATESAGDVTIGARTSAKVQSTGAGQTVITGKPACSVTAIGSGSVRCGPP